DPRNPWVKLVSGAGLASQVEVPGDGPQYYDVKPVPHGLIQILTYESASAGATRQAWVYTPPDYGATTKRYPVLYLLHGGGDLDPGWTLTGRAPIIMDNLIAEKKAVPMIVVMPLARGGGSLGLGPAGMSPGIAASGNLAPPARGGTPAPGGGCASGQRRAARPWRSTAARRWPRGARRRHDGNARTRAAAGLREGFRRRSAAGGGAHFPGLAARRGSGDRRPLDGRRGDDQRVVHAARSVPLRHRAERRGRAEPRHRVPEILRQRRRRRQADEVDLDRRRRRRLRARRREGARCHADRTWRQPRLQDHARPPRMAALAAAPLRVRAAVVQTGSQ